MDRREFLIHGTAAGIAAGTLPSHALGYANTKDKQKRYQNGISPWPVCLDTATVRPASLPEKVRIAVRAGYDAIEPWDNELEEFEAAGGNLSDLGKEIRDQGLFVPSVIGLWNSLPPTQSQWERSLKGTRRRMRMAADIGARHIQTIPDTVGENYDLKWVAARYHDLIEIGLNEYGISPALVFVKYFPVKTMGQAAAIALDANHPGASIIPDIFHMYISEGGFQGLKLLKGDMFAIFQFNDAPASPPLHELGDAHRVFPGDGILPLPQILRDLKKTGFGGCISLELYNPEYWKQDLQQVAATGLEKTLAVIAKAGV